MQYEQLSYPSSDGKNTVAAYFFCPDEGISVKGVVQISHGMCDYIARFTHFAEALTSAGYVVCGNDHLGHGQTAASPEDFGFFAYKDGVGFVLDDLHALTGIAKERYPDLPYFLFGHSMGSFLCRLYATRFGYELDGLIINGTSGPNPLLPVGRWLSKLIRLFKGERFRSKMIRSLTFSGYNKRYPEKDRQDSNAWVTSDEEVRAFYNKDPYCSFTFTVSGYLDLFSMIRECNIAQWFDSFPKDLRTLVTSGAQDPVGKWGEGPTYVAETLREHGVGNVKLKLYSDARHETHNEIYRNQFFTDIVAWLDNSSKAGA